MEKKKEESALSVLMRYAGGHKYCTYFSWVFSGLQGSWISFVIMGLSAKKREQSRVRF